MERNALRANLVRRAEDWRWSSLWQRCQQTGVPWLHPWPLPLPADWLGYVNRAETERELAALRRCVLRGAPYGEEYWQEQTAQLWAWNPPRGAPADLARTPELQGSQPDPFERGTRWKKPT